MNNETFPFWAYVQIRHLLKKPNRRPDWSGQTTPFEALCLKQEPQAQLISYIYTLLFNKHNPKCNLACRQWENDLAIDLSEHDSEKIYTCIHKGTVNIYAQENAFKLFSRWYRTPLRIHKIFPSLSSHCWRCEGEPDSLLHIW